jgi:hypothetical protein
MTSDPDVPKVAWHLPSVVAEWRWTIAVLLLPQIAAIITLAFFARGLTYRPVPVVSVNASVYYPSRGLWSANNWPYSVEGDFVVQTSAGAATGSRFTTSDFLLSDRWNSRILNREAADFNSRKTAYMSDWTGEILLVRFMHPAALPIVLFAFALMAGACESWTRILHMSEPPSRRERKTLRASTATLLLSWCGLGGMLAVALFFLPMFVPFYIPLWLSLPLLILADLGSIVLWSQGKLPSWATD